MGSNPSNPSNPSHQTWPSASLCRCSHWTPEGHCRYTGSFVPFSLQTHKNVVYDFQNYTTYVCFKSELLDPKNHLPAVIFKFLTTTPNLTSNFETHKNIGKNFDYIYRYMYTLSMYPKGINIIEGYFGYQK